MDNSLLVIFDEVWLKIAYYRNFRGTLFLWFWGKYWTHKNNQLYGIVHMAFGPIFEQVKT